MSDIFEKIDNLSGGGMIFGTERTRALLDNLGAPDDKLKIIHIAGTNGKGSIAQYITQILIAAGKRTGTFTSPAAIDYFEQFAIDGEPIKEEKLAQYFTEAFDLGRDCTAFEVQAAGALYAFYNEGCEYAVVECGLGGLNDATNAINKKELAVISSIGLEHTQVLGDTITEICEQKAGIIKNCPAVINPLQPEEAVRYFKNLDVIFADKPLEIIESKEDFQRFKYDGDEYAIRMGGNAQVFNAVAAIESARLLGFDTTTIRTGLKRAFLAGRLQFIKAKGNTYIVDGAHNPQSFGPLAAALGNYDGQKITIIFGCLSDKDIDKNLQALKGPSRHIIAVQPDSKRAMNSEKITAACKKYFDSVETKQNVSRALEKSVGTVVVCGSFTLVKEAINWIEKEP